MNKTKLNIGIVNAAGIRVNPNLIVGDTGSYSSGDILDANAVEAVIQFKSGMPETYKVGDDGQLYYIKDNGFYPVSHPDLSTQPSVLSQRFGNLDIKEVLIANGRENEIPSDAMVIEAWSFNKTLCIAAYVRKTQNGWSISNAENIVPDFTLVRYVGEQNDYYYTSGGGSVTPVTLTPNFEFPITAANLGEKTMTASSHVTFDDLVNGLKLTDENGGEWGIDGSGHLSDGSDPMNTVNISSDRLTVSFGNLDYTGPTFTGFTFNE